MLLYNQTKGPLRFDNTDGVLIEWEPFGVAEVPDRLVADLKSQGFRVDVAPVPAETKAAVVAEDAASAQRRDAVEKLKSELAAARAAEAAAKATAEDALGQLGALKKAVASAEAEADAAQSKSELLAADKAALEELLTETAKKLESAEARIAQAEALAAAKKESKSSK